MNFLAQTVLFLASILALQASLMKTSHHAHLLIVCA
jgi:hypothetical protein